MIFVVNGRKKSGIEYPNAYLLQGGGAFFLGNASPCERVAQNRVGTQIKRLFTVYNEFGGVQVYEITALEFILNQNQLRQESTFSENNWFFSNI